jgi:hypothetical protein
MELFLNLVLQFKKIYLLSWVGVVGGITALIGLLYLLYVFYYLIRHKEKILKNTALGHSFGNLKVN